MMTEISKKSIKRGVSIKEKAIFLTAECCSDLDRVAIGKAFDYECRD